MRTGSRALTLLGPVLLLAACAAGQPTTTLDVPSGGASSGDAGDASVDVTQPPDAAVVDHPSMEVATSDAPLATDAGPGVAAVGLETLHECDGDVRGMDAVTGVGDVQLPRVIWAGDRWAVTWSARVDATLEASIAPLGADGRREVASTRPISPVDGALSAFARALWNGREFGAVFDDDRAGGAGGRRSWFTRNDARAEPVSGSSFTLSTATGAQSYPGLAWSPERHEWGVVWNESTSGVWFARVDADGRMIDGSRTSVATAASVGDSGSSPVVWTGSRWAVAYAAAGSVVVAVLRGDGAVDRRIAVPGGARPARPALAWDGSGYGLAWSHGDVTLSPPQRVRFARVAEDGADASPVELGAAGLYSGEAAVAWNGREHVVVWAEQPDMGSQRVRLARIDRAGALVTRLTLACRASFQWWPHIAAGGASGRDLAVTWQSGATIAQHDARWILLR